MHCIYIKEFRPNSNWHPDVHMYWRLIEVDAKVLTQKLLRRCKIG